MGLIHCADISRKHLPAAECWDCSFRREQRRYEIARDVMAALYTDGPNWPTTPSCDLEGTFTAMAVKAADALLKALEPGETE